MMILRISKVGSGRLVAGTSLRLLVTLLAACGEGSSDGPSVTPTPGGSLPASPTPIPTPEPAPPTLLLRLSEVTSGLERPLFVTAAPGDRERLYVVEQSGRIRVVAAGALRAEPFLDLRDEVSCCVERGLLGLAFHPEYEVNGRFFVDYTDRAGATVVAEYRAMDPERAEPEAVRVLLRVEQPFANHNGGMLAFGSDGFLWIGMGDGGAAGDPLDQAQDLSSKLGKLLRIDVDRYPEPPPGNLPGGDPDVWALGLRNPWRFSFDRATGDLYVGDVGQNRFEEVNVTPAALIESGQGGPNYGWPIFEGFACYDPPADCDRTGLTQPRYAYGRQDGCSVTGGYVYRGASIPALAGRYLFGDYCSNRIWAVPAGLEAGEVVELTGAIEGADAIAGLASFGEDADGEIYIVSLSGRLLRFEAR